MAENTPPTESAPEEDENLSGLLETPTEDAAPETPETPETPAATPEETPEPDEATPAAAAPQPETPAPAALPPADPLVSELRTLTEQIEGDEFDPFSKEGKKALMRRQDLAAFYQVRQAGQQAEQVQTFWETKADEIGVSERQLRSAWRDELKKAEKKYGAGTQASVAVATEAWETRAQGMKKPAPAPETPATAPTPAAAPTPAPVSRTRIPIQPKPGAVAPPAASPHRPPAPGTDPGTAFDKSMTRDDLAGFVV